MKSKPVEKVISDLRKLFKLDEQIKKDSQEITGTFFIYRKHFKRKKAKKIVNDYFEKTTITDGFLVMQKKTIAYSLIFKICKNGTEKKKEEKENQKTKGKKNHKTS